MKPPQAKALRWVWACPACAWRSPPQNAEALEEVVYTFWWRPLEAKEATAAELEAELDDLLHRWRQVDQLGLLQTQTAGGQSCGSCGGTECRVAAPPREAQRLRRAYRHALGKASTVLALMDLMAEGGWRFEEEPPEDLPD